MPDLGCLVGSVMALALGISFILFPHAVLDLSRSMNRTLGVLDDELKRSRLLRYVLGVSSLALSWGLFKLSIFLPLFRELGK